MATVPHIAYALGERIFSERVEVTLEYAGYAKDSYYIVLDEHGGFAGIVTKAKQEFIKARQQ